MAHYLWLGLRQQRGRTLLASVGFLVAACALLLLSAATQATVFRTTQLISLHWRPTYDLVVVPAHQAVPSPGSSIPPDQFEGFTGRISMQQYAEIQHLPGVSVAAPIAFISYVQYPMSTIDFGSYPPGFYQLSWTLTASNGQRSIVEYQTTTIVYALKGHCPPTLAGRFCQPLTQKQFAPLQAIGVGDYFYSADTYFTGVPNPGAFLLAAIDPVAENQLVHLNQSLVFGGPLPEQITLARDPEYPMISGVTASQKVPNYDVPLLINTQLPGAISLHVSLSRLVTASTDPQQIAALGGSAYLNSAPRQPVFVSNVPLPQNDLQLFSEGNDLVLRGSSLVVGHPGYTKFPLNFTTSPSSLTYRPTTPPPGARGPAYTLVPGSQQPPPGTSGSEVAFRSLNPLPGKLTPQKGFLGQSFAYETTFDTIYNNAAYTARPVGRFDGSRLAASFGDALNWLPENTYTPSPVILRYNAQGQPVAPVSLLPTTNQAGFTLEPPLALTTLAAARQILGDRCISVIRVRVEGNVTPDQAGWERVARVAQEIHDRTGLEAIVTLGASPRPTLVYVPGLQAGQMPGVTQTIPPIGWVEERWITIGAGLIYLHQLGTIQSLLLSGVLLASLGYVILTMQALLVTQRGELAILSALGWRSWHLATLLLGQALILALSGGLVGSGLALLLCKLLGLSPPTVLIVWTLPAMLGLALLGVLAPLGRIWRLQPASLLRSGSVIRPQHLPATPTRRSASLGVRLFPLTTLAVRNLIRVPLRTLLLVSSLLLSTLLLVVTIMGLLAFRQQLQGTLLGQEVLLQTALPQLASVLFAILLTFLSVADLLVLEVHERQSEIALLQAVGWTPRLVQGMVLREGLLLALMGSLPGLGLAFALLRFQQQQPAPAMALLVGTGAVAFLLLVTVLATLPALRLIGRLRLPEILRRE
ncbi:FtsX-like permease family protein [Thermogemmatispora onikobensis]|uniref:FtsX-like permease family protein n=1 Tax=Thermogemmatispora onikobensis TaxID=732234 RepID=UPI000853BB7C|nr:ABC transporter permease [Thermogemmatispora onikobensis]